ncbi:MAG TPA: response regulator [Anaerolineales bacterium]|nr:response regulator [Anaerolineales bacterium]
MVGKTILIVDGNPASRTFLTKYLRAKQFEILEAPTGKEALILAWRHEPDLVLFDPTLADIPDKKFILKLRNDARTEKVRLVALSSDPSPARREICLSAGVDEYLVKSSQAVPALEQILTRVFETKIPAESALKADEKNGLLIVFLSAKGGTGTSSLCANLAMNIQQSQLDARVVVADLVLPIGSIGPVVGSDGVLNLVTVSDLPAEQTNADYFHAHLPKPERWQYQVLTGSPDPEQGNSIKGERISEIVDILCSAYDFIILDIGRSLSRISLPLIQKADLIVLIASTDQSTVKLTKTVYEYLQTQGVKSEKIYAILNRAVGLEGMTKIQAEEIIGLPIKTTLPYMGGNFALANNLNQPITLKYPTDTASIILKGAAEEIVNLARRIRQGA